MRVQEVKRERKKIRNEGISSHKRDAGKWWEGRRDGGRGRASESLELLKVGEKSCNMDEIANCSTAKIMMANRWREKEMEKLLFWQYLLLKKRPGHWPIKMTY